MKDLVKMRVILLGLVFAFAGLFMTITPSFAAVPMDHARESVMPYHGMPGTGENSGLFWDSVTGAYYGFDPTGSYDYRIGGYDREYIEFEYRTPGLYWNAEIGHWQSHFEFYEDRGFTANDPNVPATDPASPFYDPSTAPSPTSSPAPSASPSPSPTSSPSATPLPSTGVNPTPGEVTGCINIDPFNFKFDVPCIVEELFVPSEDKKALMDAEIDKMMNTRFPFNYVIGMQNVAKSLFMMQPPACVPFSVDVSGFAGANARMEIFPCNAQFAAVFRPLTYWLFGFVIMMLCGQWVWSLFRPTLPSERG
jgi:hypothetical protein